MLTIIIPTLNEVENIELLVRTIYDFMPSSSTQVLIVDDDSDDGSHELIRNLQDKFENLSLIVRKGERGLGSAVRSGATMVGERPVIVMDADLSHHPRFLPGLARKLEEGYDLVVGSRYVPGGATVGWPGSRIAISKIATYLARIFFQIRVKDPMSGFVACKSGQLLADGFRYADFKFLLEMTVSNRSLKVAEVPIVFQDRIQGRSKLDGKNIALYLMLLVQLMLSRS